MDSKLSKDSEEAGRGMERLSQKQARRKRPQEGSSGWDQTQGSRFQRNCGLASHSRQGGVRQQQPQDDWHFPQEGPRCCPLSTVVPVVAGGQCGASCHSVPTGGEAGKEARAPAVSEFVSTQVPGHASVLPAGQSQVKDAASSCSWQSPSQVIKGGQ